MHSYDIEANNLDDLAEDSEDEDSNNSGRKRTSFEDANGHRAVMNGTGEGSSFGPPRRARTMESERVGMGAKGFDRIGR
jgi:magnesium transporter